MVSIVYYILLIYIFPDAKCIGDGSTALDHFRTMETWIFLSDFPSKAGTSKKIPILSFGDIEFNLFLSSPGEFQLDFSIGSQVM
jgi:hypothetical protein